MLFPVTESTGEKERGGKEEGGKEREKEKEGGGCKTRRLGPSHKG